MKRFLFYLLLVLFLATTNQNAQSNTKGNNDVTIDWIFGEDPGKITSVPFFEWIDNEELILYDDEKPIDQQAFVKFNPSTGEEIKLFEIITLIGNLSEFFGDDTKDILRSPSAVNSQGSYAVMNLKSDLYLVNLANVYVKKITNDESAEIAVSFSPDGEKVGFVRDNNLYYYDIVKNKEIALTRDGSDVIINGTFSWVYWEEIYGHRANAYWWSDDSQSIAFLRSDDSEIDISYYTDFEPYRPNVYKQRYPKAGEKSPEVTVGIVNITDGKKVWMDLPLDTYEYVVRVDWIPDNEHIGVQTMNRAQDEINLWSVSTDDGSTQLILKETDNAWLHVYKPYFYKDAEHFLWISERDGYTHIYRYDMSGKLLNRVTKGEWSLRPFGAFAMYGAGALVAVDEDNDWIYFTSGEKSSLEMHLYKIKPDGSNKSRITKDNGTHYVIFSGNTKYFLDYYSNISTPPSFAVYTSNGKLIDQITEPRFDLLAPYDFQYPEIFTVPADDGFEMPAQITKPRNFDPNKKYPVVIYVYGGLSAQTVVNDWNSNGWAESIYFDQVLVNNDYLVFTFDNRAATAKSKILESTIKKNMYSDVELNDLLAAVKWLKQQNYVDPDRIGIWGWSGGATYTLLALTHSEEFKAGISVAPVTDWHYYDVKWAECVMKRPVDNPDGYEKTSLVKHAKDLSGKLMLVHGTYDDNVHIQNSWAFANELISNNIMFDMMIYPMRKHGISDAPARIHLFNKMLNFWKANL